MEGYVIMKLIINADDYGCTIPVSLGIIEGMKYGVITSTSAIISCKYFQQMATYALEHGINHMGVHCILTMVKPTLPLEQVTTLVNEQGNFFSRAEFMDRKVSVAQARTEIENQIKIFLATGLKLDHLDTHHCFWLKDEEFFQMLLEIAEKYQVPLRNEIVRKDKQRAQEYLGKLTAKEVKVPDDLYFNHGTPHHTISDIKKFLFEAMLESEVVEIGCRPGHSDDYLRSISVLNDEREIDLDVMTSKELKNFITQNRIELIDYTEI